MVGFEVLFEAGRRFAEGVVEPRPAGTVSVPSGRIVVGDPTTGGHAALVRRVPPGKYPASISVARLRNDEKRVAAAMLRFRAGRVVIWEPALPEGKNPDDAPTPEAYFGYGVDGGLACFADAGAPLPHDVNAGDNGRCTGVELPLGRHTIAVFSADKGTYASYWGLDGAGNPIVLVTDFRLVGTRETGGAEMLSDAWPGSALDEEITQNWEGRDIVTPLPVAVEVSEGMVLETVKVEEKGQGKRAKGERRRDKGQGRTEKGQGKRGKAPAKKAKAKPVKTTKARPVKPARVKPAKAKRRSAAR